MGARIGFVQAAPALAMRDVASAFLWIKFDPQFPAVFTREEKDFILFRVFDERYLIERKKHSFIIYRKPFPVSSGSPEETTTIDAIDVEKILYFSKADERARAVLNRDQFYSSIRAVPPPSGFQNSKTIFQCKSDLPSRPPAQNGPLNQILHHTWIQNGRGESFGMPNTDQATYFGGLAHIRRPDSFIIRGPTHLDCAPVWSPLDRDEREWSKEVACIAGVLSVSQNPIFGSEVLPSWVADFDYHVLERNCLLATRFVIECAEGKAPITINSGIGGSLNWNDLYAIHELSPLIPTEVRRLKGELAQLRLEDSIQNLSSRIEPLLNQALEVDSMARGVKAIQVPKNLREICDLALKACKI